MYTTEATGYSTAAELTTLASDVGTLSPALAAGVRDLTLTVPTATTSVSLDLDPAVGSGLVTVDGVLIDDTVRRTVPLATTGTTSVVIESSAQDHSTSVTYRLSIVRASAVTVEAAAATRCVAGKVVLTVTARNTSTAPAAITLASGWGSTPFSGVAPGGSASHAFTTRAASVPAGSATVTAGGTPVATAYPAFTCR